MMTIIKITTKRGVSPNQGNKYDEAGGKCAYVKLPFCTNVPQFHFEGDGAGQPHHEEGGCFYERV